jgi:ornithine cyclodeaminase/alanine dehydrogenase-like protein (mu-crystallin family)
MPLRFGVIGAGTVAETHLRAMQMLPDVRPVAVADVGLGRARALAARYGISRPAGPGAWPRGEFSRNGSPRPVALCVTACRAADWTVFFWRR